MEFARARGVYVRLGRFGAEVGVALSSDSWIHGVGNLKDILMPVRNAIEGDPVQDTRGQMVLYISS